MIEVDGFCGALFDTPHGSGVCEAFGSHERHGGVVRVGVFRCHRCRRETDKCHCRPVAAAQPTESAPR